MRNIDTKQASKINMTWCNSSNDHHPRHVETASPSSSSVIFAGKSSQSGSIKTCPSCGNKIQLEEQGGGAGGAGGAGIQDLPGLPSGVKFDPTDQELLEHLEGKARPDSQKHHPLIDEFIPTLEGENGICYTHPEKLPGVSRDGLIRHFFHRPSKAYTTGTRKRRKVHTDVHGGETRWHKTGKTRPVLAGGETRGYKKILVLYTNYGKLKKPEKTNWVMHQYHLGSDEEEKDGELVVSKVFYQTQPRQCSSAGSKDHQIDQMKSISKEAADADANANANNNIAGYYGSSTHHLLSYSNQGSSAHHLMPNFTVHAGGTSFLQ